MDTRFRRESAGSRGAAPSLLVESLDAEPRFRELTGESIAVGSDPGCALSFSDRSVAAHHAQLTVLGPDRFRLDPVDEGSGVFVNHRGISEPRDVVPGDVIQLGRRGPRFEIRAMAEVPSPTAPSSVPPPPPPAPVRAPSLRRFVPWAAAGLLVVVVGAVLASRSEPAPAKAPPTQAVESPEPAPSQRRSIARRRRTETTTRPRSIDGDVPSRSRPSRIDEPGGPKLEVPSSPPAPEKPAPMVDLQNARRAVYVHLVTVEDDAGVVLAYGIATAVVAPSGRVAYGAEQTASAVVEAPAVRGRKPGRAAVVRHYLAVPGASVLDEANARVDADALAVAAPDGLAARRLPDGLVELRLPVALPGLSSTTARAEGYTVVGIAIVSGDRPARAMTHGDQAQRMLPGLGWRGALSLTPDGGVSLVTRLAPDGRVARTTPLPTSP